MILIKSRKRHEALSKKMKKISEMFNKYGVSINISGKTDYSSEQIIYYQLKDGFQNMTDYGSYNNDHPITQTLFDFYELMSELRKNLEFK